MNKAARPGVHILASKLGLKGTAAGSVGRSAWVVVLIVSVLFAQFTGLLHRIEHAKRLGNQDSIGLYTKAVANFDSPFSPLFDGGKKNTSHSCAAFDAATLADTLNTQDCGAIFPGEEDSAPFLVADSSWKAPIVQNYLSRAPPLGLI